MNVSSLVIFQEKIKLKKILYMIFILSIIFIILFILNFSINMSSLEVYGNISDNNILEISNLKQVDTNYILNSKKMIINDEKFNIQIIDILGNDDSYLIKLKIDKIYLKDEKLKIKFIEKDIKLYKFLYETMKGDV